MLINNAIVGGFLKFISVTCALALLLGVPALAQTIASEPEPDPAQSTISQPYDFPIRPESDEWEKLDDHAELVNVLQVPQDILEQMTTEAVVKTAIDYPFWNDMFYFDSLQLGFEAVCRNSNAFAEVLKRPDAGKVLSEIYEQTPMYALEDGSFLDLYVNDVLEMFLLQDSVMEQLDSAEQNTLTQIIHDKYAVKREHPEIYTPNYGGAYELLLNTSSNRGGTGTFTTLRTPNGTEFGATDNANVDEYDNAEKQEYRNQVESKYPTATVIGDASPRYNCHSYAWYNPSTSNHYWINLISPFIDDGSYTQAQTPFAGYQIYYSYDNHSAIMNRKVGSDIWVISKWGDGCLVKHKIGDCPYDQGHYEYYYLT